MSATEYKVIPVRIPSEEEVLKVVSDLSRLEGKLEAHVEFLKL